MIKVFVTDEHEMYLEGLALLLGNQRGITVTGTALSSDELLSKLPQIDADILLLDVFLPDPDEEALLKKIREIRPQQKIVYLSLLRGTRYVHKLMRHGIQGYILKNSSISELSIALQKIQNGEQYFSKEIDIRDEESVLRNTIMIGNKYVHEILTRREQQVLKLICHEFSNARIAEKLFLSVSTVETHRKKIIAKLGVNNTVGLVKFAVKHLLAD
jgi:two-component system response regulator NreC